MSSPGDQGNSSGAGEGGGERWRQEAPDNGPDARVSSFENLREDSWVVSERTVTADETGRAHTSRRCSGQLSSPFQRAEAKDATGPSHPW